MLCFVVNVVVVAFVVLALVFVLAVAVVVVLKNFIDQSETKRCTKKSDPIFRCTTPSTGKRLGVRSRRWYTTLCSVPTTTSNSQSLPC